MPIETRLLSNADLSQIHPMKQEVHYFYGQVPHPSLKTVSLNKNHSTGTSSSIYSGGAIWVYANTSKIMNCTFVNNTSDHPGDAIYSLSSSSSIILNSIFCGSANQFASNITSYNVSYCAFETSKPLYSTNSIILDSGNGGNGPNFTDPSTSDYSIIYISPCRDAGASTGAPLTDYLGNGRVGPYDIYRRL